MSKAMMSVSEAVVTRQLDQIDALRRIATQATDPSEVRTRKGRGGMVYKYVDGPYVIRSLNQAFGHDWDFEADNEEVINFNGQPFEVRCRGRLTVRLNGQAVTKMQYGSQAIEFIKDKQGNNIAPVTIGDAFKGAATDAMKKCASLLGIALDLYDSDYKAEKYAEPEPESPADILLGLNRKLGYTEVQLLKWLIGKFNIDPGLTLHSALGSLGEGELSMAIDIFRDKSENRGK